MPTKRSSTRWTDMICILAHFCSNPLNMRICGRRTKTCLSRPDSALSMRSENSRSLPAISPFRAMRSVSRHNLPCETSPKRGPATPVGTRRLLLDQTK